MIDLDSILYANSKLIPDIYETAVDPTRWNETLAATAEFLGADSSMHSLTFWASGRGRAFSYTGMPEGSMDIWEKKYATNEWPRTAATLPVGEVMHTELPSMEDMMKTDLGRDILAHTGWVDVMAVKTTDSSLYLGALSFYAKSRFEGPMLERFEFLIPHFSRALALHQRIARLSLEAQAFQAGMQQLPAAVFLLSFGGEILYENDAATTLIGQDDGIGVLDSRLVLGTPHDRQALDLAIEQAREPDPGQGARGLFRIARRSGLRPYHAVVSPVVPQLISAKPSEAVFLWVTDPESRVVPVVDSLGPLLGLTPAESRIAAAIARGQNVQEYAAEQGIKEGSARWTLKQVLAKTNARNQADLVRIILHSIPSPPF